MEQPRAHRVLLHSCCAPCTIYPLDRLRAEGLAVTGFFYNPNVHPFSEFEKRLQAVTEYYRVMETELIVDATYNVDEYLRIVYRPGASRCESCWRMRLQALAGEARKIGADAMTTTLLFSIHQDHDVVRGIGSEAAADAGIEFYYEDFRSGWEVGRRRTLEHSIYRQKYCGCIFSEQERYNKKIAALMKQKRRAL